MFIRKAETWTKTMKVIWEAQQSNSAFKFTEWWKIHISREFVPYIDDAIADSKRDLKGRLWSPVYAISFERRCTLSISSISWMVEGQGDHADN